MQGMINPPDTGSGFRPLEGHGPHDFRLSHSSGKGVFKKKSRKNKSRTLALQAKIRDLAAWS